jgi:flagellar hook assembly protein FlgD
MASRSEAAGPEEELAAPTTFRLYNNYPNPFNPSTTVRFDVPEPSEVLIVVYSLLGEEVARIYDGYREAGRYTVRWEGTSESGGRAASGVYLLRMQARRLNGEVFTEIRRMLLVK